MTSEPIKIQIEDLLSPEPSGWLKDAQWRSDNQAWLNISYGIALKVLISMREQGKDKTWLAEQLNVTKKRISKMMKGKENFTIETITQLEKALNISLINLNNP